MRGIKSGPSGRDVNILNIRPGFHFNIRSQTLSKTSRQTLALHLGKQLRKSQRTLFRQLDETY